MKTLTIIIIVFLAIFAACGEDNPTNNNNNSGNNSFQGNYHASVYQSIGFQYLYSFDFNVQNNGAIVNVTIGDSLGGITATFHGNVTNDSNISFTSVVNYMNTIFTNAITGNMTDSNGTRYLTGTIKLLGNTIGTFAYNFNGTLPNGIFQTPGLTRKFNIEKR